MAEATRWIVPAELSGERLDRIVSQISGLTRSQVRDLIDGRALTVDGEVLAGSTRLTAGTEIVGVVPAPKTTPQPAAVPFTVLFEDGDVLVVDKPAGVVVHPGAGHSNDTLLNGLVARFPELAALGEQHRYGILHRLDRGTSGALIVARSPSAHAALTAALRARAIERVYLALAEGSFDADSGTIDAPIGRDPANPTRRALAGDGRPARTHNRVMATWPGATLLEVRLETGRTHQIRVHLSSIGRPLAGDAVYGHRGGPGDLGRVWLHAAAVRFRHPTSGETIAVAAPLPADLARSLRRLGTPQRGGLPAGLE